MATEYVDVIVVLTPAEQRTSKGVVLIIAYF